MGRPLALLYGIAAYILFFLTFLYAIGFVEGAVVSKTIDSGQSGGLAASVIIDLVVLSVFALQHSIMARPAFKRAWTRIVPPALERTTYVVAASLALMLVIWGWRPIAGTLWDVSGSPLGVALRILSLFGWGVVLLSTFLISHFELFGLQQSYAAFRGVEPPTLRFGSPLFYRYVRHPIYLGFIIAFWATPTMSMGHLLFAAVTTAYILVGATLEERDLVGQFGETYVAYRRRVSMIIPRPPRAG